MPESRPPVALTGQSLDALAAVLSARTLPPVDRWHPDHCGNSDMVIRRDGSWTYRGDPIARPAMVRQFASVLRREPDGSHVLVTPAERLTIAVESTPFRAIALTSEGEGRDRRLAFELDHADALIVGPAHPLTVIETPHGPSPRVLVRHGLEAELSRPLYYELAEIALAEGYDPPGIWSDGAFFPLVPVHSAVEGER
ncbi:DUF1285 domain-containing protein [Sphingomonas sp.]|uniref:DUF1285 domain-containing protein n=1 Tax=Sphingomonas sp. TaxID=28214 RepID=UPI00286A9251|nr:DUF1285 domain-containing protein [Sphingomonas sp.]